MGRPKNTEKRREQIIEGLLDVVARDGYERATVVAIAEAAGLRPGLVHYHFETKQEILDCAIARLIRQVDQRYATRRAECDGSPSACLAAFIDAHLALGRDADPRGVAVWASVGAEAIRLPEVREVYSRAIATRLDEAKKLLMAVLRSEKRSTRSVQRMAAALVSAVEGAFLVAVGAPNAVPEGFAAPMVQQMVDGLIAGAKKK